MSPSTATDPTFRSYTASQAKYYSSVRLSYAPALYDLILNHHIQTGGHLTSLLDLGCGPGNATRDIALWFDTALGLDPGEQMINTARELGGKTKTGAPIRFEVAAAEDFSGAEGVGAESVDLVIVAMAAHWFDMGRFWGEAAGVVKSGGTVALWTGASAFCHPDTPKYEQIQAIMLRLERETLAPFELPQNRLARDMYDNLPLPWTIANPVTSFPQSEFVKHDFDREGVLSDGVDFFGGGSVQTVDETEKNFNSASMVTRWREAYPDCVGERDVVRAFGNELRTVLPGSTKIKTGSGTTILLFKKV